MTLIDTPGADGPLGAAKTIHHPASHHQLRNEMVTPTPGDGYALAGYISEAITMNTVALVGADLGKHSFHLHAQDATGRAVFRKKLSRLQMMRLFGNLPACTVVMEACAGAHFTARVLNKLGHVAKLISPQFVRSFVKSNKNDFVDAEAICEAACRPSTLVQSCKPGGDHRFLHGLGRKLPFYLGT